jgi:hypothetical protein
MQVERLERPGSPLLIRGLGELPGQPRASSPGEWLIPCAARSRLVAQAADDCVELVSGGAVVIEHEDAASLCSGGGQGYPGGLCDGPGARER